MSIHHEGRLTDMAEEQAGRQSAAIERHGGAACGKKTSSNSDLVTHLANERTFLAWCRTSIALIVFGFVIEKFDYIVNVPMGHAMHAGAAAMQEFHLISMFAFILAAALMIISGYRFLVLRKMIHRGEISFSIFPEVMVIISMVLIVGMVIVLLAR